MWSSEHSLLLQLALVPAAVGVVVAVGDAAVVAQREVEQSLHRQVVRRHRLERRPLTRVVAVVVAADGAVVAAVMQFPRFEDRQPSRGFLSSRGQQPSTTTIRRMP
jgi:hypothetical protein